MWVESSWYERRFLKSYPGFLFLYQYPDIPDDVSNNKILNKNFIQDFISFKQHIWIIKFLELDCDICSVVFLCTIFMESWRGFEVSRPHWVSLHWTEVTVAKAMTIGYQDRCDVHKFTSTLSLYSIC